MDLANFMQKKIRQEYELNVLRDLVHAVNWSLVPRVPVRDETHCVLHENGQRF